MLHGLIERMARRRGLAIVSAEDVLRLAILDAGGYGVLTKRRAQEIRHIDFIPRGRRIPQGEPLEFRRTHQCEIYHCCCCTGNDLQSGPHYCGDVAEWIALTVKGEIVAVCKEHKNRRRYHLCAIRES